MFRVGSHYLALFLKNMAVRQHSINPKYRKDFLRNLVASGEEAGLIAKLDKQTIQFNSVESKEELNKKDQDTSLEETTRLKKRTDEHAEGNILPYPKIDNFRTGP
jgi:hypothetical protein